MILNILALIIVQQWAYVFSDETLDILSYIMDLKNWM